MDRPVDRSGMPIFQAVQGKISSYGPMTDRPLAYIRTNIYLIWRINQSSPCRTHILGIRSCSVLRSCGSHIPSKPLSDLVYPQFLHSLAPCRLVPYIVHHLSPNRSDPEIAKCLPQPLVRDLLFAYVSFLQFGYQFI